MDWKQELFKLAGETLLGAFGIVATMALLKLRTWADAKGEESKIAKALAVLPHMAEAIYAEIHEALAPEITADLADGQFSPEELQALREHAVSALKQALSKHGLETLREAFGPLLEGILGRVIAVAQAKVTASAAAASVAASPK